MYESTNVRISEKPVFLCELQNCKILVSRKLKETAKPSHTATHNLFKRRIRCIVGHHASPAGVIICSMPNTRQKQWDLSAVCQPDTNPEQRGNCDYFYESVWRIIQLHFTSWQAADMCTIFIPHTHFLKGNLCSTTQSFYCLISFGFRFYLQSAPTQDIDSQQWLKRAGRDHQAMIPLFDGELEKWVRGLYHTAGKKRASPILNSGPCRQRLQLGVACQGRMEAPAALNAGTSS